MRTLSVVFLLIVVSGLAGGCFERKATQDDMPCQPGLQGACYTGPEGTAGVGVCTGGFSICHEQDGVLQEECFGETLPTEELCNQLDDNCDGQTDEGDACASQQIADLEKQIGGQVHTLMVPGRIGPALLLRPTWGALYLCLDGELAIDCAQAFLTDNGAVWGISSLEEQLVPAPGQEDGQRLAAHFTQVHQGIPLEGRWLSVARTYAPDIRGDAIVAVRARLADPKFLPDPIPLVEPDSLIAKLPQGATLLAGPTLVYSERSGELQGPDGEDPVFDLAYKVSYVQGESSFRMWFDAIVGDEIRTLPDETPDLRRELTQAPATSPQWTDFGPAPTAPPTGGDALTTWNTMADWTAFMVDTDVVDVGNTPTTVPPGVNPAVFLDSAVHFEMGIDVTAGCCAGSCCGVQFGDQINICAASGCFDIETIAHESGHLLADRYWMSNSYIDNRQHDALVETFSQFGAELFECYQDSANCGFQHNGTNDFATPVSLASLPAASPDLAIPAGSDTKYVDARVPGSALHELYLHLRADGASSDLAALVTMSIMAYSMQYFDATSAAGADATALEFTDFLSALSFACDNLAGQSRQVDHNGEIHAIGQADCTALYQAFVKVGVVTACDIPQATDTCDGFDNDCDGSVDNQVGTLDPLERLCSWDAANPLPPLPEVGVCRNGVQQCQAGIWGACQGAVGPATNPPEICDGLDNDCDGYDDNHGVQLAWAPDEDLDGYWADTTVWFGCKKTDAPLGSNWIPREPGKEDCNDDPAMGAAIHPGASECPPPLGAGDNVDNDCDGEVDEGCLCANVANPSDKGAKVFCGPVAPDCIGQPFDADSVAECTVSYSEWCVAGFQKCEYDVGKNGWYWSSCVGSQTGGPEICDGEDNDCDGKTDTQDSLVVGLSPTCGKGGHEVCSANGMVECEGEETPAECTQASTTVTALPKYIPPKVGGGDSDFDSSVVNVNGDVTISISANGRQILADACVHFKEANDDWTEANGCAPTYPVLSLPDGCYLGSVQFEGIKSTCAFQEHDCDQDDLLPGTEDMGACQVYPVGPVALWTFIGDTDGDDVGVRSAMTVLLGPIEYEYCCE